MSTPRITPGIQLAIVYSAAALWYGIIMAAALIGKSSGAEFMEDLPVICLGLFLVAPILYIYFMLRIAMGERAFIAKHRILFRGALALGIGPVLYLCLLVFVPYL